MKTTLLKWSIILKGNIYTGQGMVLDIDTMGPNVDFTLGEGLSWEGLCLWWNPTNESQANEYLRQKEQCLQNSDMNSLASWGNLEDGGQMQV